MPDTLDMIVSNCRDLTPLIREYVLKPVSDARLPAADPGAHIAVKTPSGAWRQYSLVDPTEAPDHYRIAVKREAAGRGGSASIHEGWSTGTAVTIQPPSNDFAVGDAPKYLLIAGGIGVTPIYSMAQALVGDGADVRMIYCTRSLVDTAYGSELEALLGDRLTLHHDGGDLDQVYDFWDHFAEPQMMHVYCCGPGPLMEEIGDISGHWPEGRVNFEDFVGIEAAREDDTAFEIRLEKSGTTLEVPSDRSILETLREVGKIVPSSCESGTCGTCKCGLVSGDVDHRDMVLMDEEKTDHIIICVSRAKAGALVIDL